MYIPLWVPSPVPVATPGRTPRPPNPDQRRRDNTCNLFCKQNLLYWYIVYFIVPSCIYLSYVWYVSTYLGLGQIHLDRVQARQCLCDIILTQYPTATQKNQCFWFKFRTAKPFAFVFLCCDKFTWDLLWCFSTTLYPRSSSSGTSLWQCWNWKRKNVFYRQNFHHL